MKCKPLRLRKVLLSVLLGGLVLGCQAQGPSTELDMLYSQVQEPTPSVFRGSTLHHGVYQSPGSLSGWFHERPRSLVTTDSESFDFDMELNWVYTGTRGEFNGISDQFGSGMIVSHNMLMFHNGTSVFGLNLDSGIKQWEVDFAPYIESRSLLELYKVSVPVIEKGLLYLTFGSNLFSLEPEDGNYTKLATWSEYFYESPVLILENRIFAMDIAGNILEFDTLQKQFEIRFSPAPILEPNPRLQTHPFAPGVVVSNQYPFQTYTYFINANSYIVVGSSDQGRFFWVHRDQLLGLEHETLQMDVPALLILSRLIPQLPLVYFQKEEPLLIIPGVQDFGTIEETTFYAFSPNHQEILWESRIPSFVLGPMVIHEFLGVIPTSKGVLALDLETGEVLWYQPREGLLSLSGFINQELQLLFLVGITAQHLELFEPETGQPLGRFLFPEEITPSDSFVTSDGPLGVDKGFIVRLGSQVFQVR